MIRIGLSVKLIGFFVFIFILTTYGILHYFSIRVFNSYVEGHRAVYLETTKSVNSTLNESTPGPYDAFLISGFDNLTRIIGARMILTDDKGMVFYDSEKVRTGQRMELENVGELKNKRMPIFHLVRTEHVRTEYIPLNNKKVSLTRLENTSLRMASPLIKKGNLYGYLVITEPLTVLENELLAIRNHIVLFMLGLLIAVSAVYYLIIRRFLLAPLSQLTVVSQKVARKEFSERVNFSSSDEMGRFGRNFNTMVYNIEKMCHEAEERAEGLMHLSAELEARNQELQRKQRVIEADLQLAHNIQQELLPRVYPQVEGIKIAVANFQYGDVGGDCFDFYRLSPKKLGTFVGDVSGKGISAALVMAMVTILFGQLKERYSTPDEILTKVNEIMYRHFGVQHSIYMTCFFMIVDLEKMCVTFSCAGHTPPLLYCSAENRIISLEAEGFGLGMFAGVNFESKTVPIQRGDKIILYTDGVVETRNTDGVMFGLDRLTQSVKTYPGANSFQLTHFLAEDIGEFAGTVPRGDDLTILVIGIEENSV
ncbi:MAG: SpoIIE family protein phosphatase [bacterium]